MVYDGRLRDAEPVHIGASGAWEDGGDEEEGWPGGGGDARGVAAGEGVYCGEKAGGRVHRKGEAGARESEGEAAEDGERTTSDDDLLSSALPHTGGREQRLSDCTARGRRRSDARVQGL